LESPHLFSSTTSNPLAGAEASSVLQERPVTIADYWADSAVDSASLHHFFDLDHDNDGDEDAINALQPDFDTYADGSMPLFDAIKNILRRSGSIANRHYPDVHGESNCVRTEVPT